jgi:capsular polysaccharide biosynthesis protein
MPPVALNAERGCDPPVTDRPAQGIAHETDEDLLPLRDIIQVLRRRIWIIALTIVVLVGAAIGSSLAQTPQYESSIKILIGQKGGADPALAPTVFDLQQLTLTMAEAVNSVPVAEEAIQRLNLQTTPEDLLENLEVQAIEETQFIEVSYTDTNAARSQRVANTIGSAFADQVSEISPSANSVTATVWEKAELPSSPVSPDPRSRAILALAMGAILGLGLAFLVEALDDSWQSPEEAEQISGVPTFGIVPAFEVPQGGKKGR